MTNQEKWAYNKMQRNRMQQNEGQRYQSRWSSMLILYCKCLLPLLFGGLVQYYVWKDDSLLNDAMACYSFFLPLTVIACIINLLMGTIIAVFGEKGMYALKEIEISPLGRLTNNLEEMVYIPYDHISRIFYRQGTSYRSSDKSTFASVEVTYWYEDGETGLRREDTCVFRCGPSTAAAKDFAKKISRRTGGLIKPEYNKARKRFFLIALSFGYIAHFIIYLLDM